MADIFISYAREDAEAAQRLAAALERRSLSVFWDRRIPAGRRFSEVIGEQLADARCVIALWSKAANASDWVLEEAEEGRKRGILAPALIEGVEPPMGFRRIHAADLIGWRGETTHVGFERLIEDIARYLPPTPPSAAPAPTPPPPPPPRVEPAVKAAPASIKVPDRPAAPATPVRRSFWALRRGQLRTLAVLFGSLAVMILIAVITLPFLRDRGTSRNQQPTAASKPEAPSSGDRDTAPPASANAQKLIDAVLAALPSAAERQRGSWRNAADAKLIQHLDAVDKQIAEVLADMDRQSQTGGFQPAWQHVDDLRAVMSPRSVAINLRMLPGLWNCRRLDVDKDGVLDRSGFSCTIQQRQNCLWVAKTSGSERFSGCLHAAGDRSLVFVGERTSLDWKGTRLGGGSEGGFLSQSAGGRLRMIVPGSMEHFDVIDFRRP
jgi:TIR domain/Domain of unknown function (DUF4893)